VTTVRDRPLAGILSAASAAAFQGQALTGEPVSLARSRQLSCTKPGSGHPALPTALPPHHLSILRGGSPAKEAMSGAAPSEARIVVLGTGKDDPSLARLELLPAGAQVVAMGASLEDFASMDAALAEANVLMVSHTPGVSFADLFSSLAARMPKLAWARRAPAPTLRAPPPPARAGAGSRARA
jgi:hypothetical protein